jgi:hypothetical protein
MPLSLALLASFPALAQDAPKVIFCSGSCFAVDANGIRTPAPKGTELRADQRFETGPGAYAQVKLGPEAAMALGDGARVRFDQKNFRDRLIVSLDVGRMRMIGGEAIGKPMTRPVELHTADGAFVLRNADIEVKKSGTANTASALTIMKVNAGDARLRSGPRETLVPKQGVQGFSAGKPITRPIAITEIALTPPPTRAVTPSPITQPVAIVPLPNLAVATSLRGDLALAPTVQPLPRTVTGVQPGSIPVETALKPPLSRGEIIPTTPIITPTGEVRTLSTYLLTDPVLTTTSTTTIKSVELLDTSTTLSTSTLSSINLTTTSTVSGTTTSLVTSPTTLTTTNITNTGTITTNTSPLILDTSTLLLRR